MRKNWIIVLALALMVGMACASYAEVQDVKVGGDLAVKGIARNNFDLSNGSAGDKRDDDASFLLSQARVRIDANLTDNVSATVRLLNERVWGVEDTANTEIDVDLAYVVLKEFLYANSPVTLTVGRQELSFGNGLIIGDVDTNRDSVLAPSYAYDLSLRKAFDAIRATLNYDPLVVDLVFAKVDEGSDLVRNDDTDLYGVNARYALSDKQSAELYYFSKVDSSKDKTDKVNVIGGMLSGELIDRVTGSLEYAYQFGKKRDSDISGIINAKRRAWALQAMLNYSLPVAEKLLPNLGLSYTYLSGDKDLDGGKYKAWDPMFENQTPNSITNALFSNTNVQVVTVSGSIKPVEDLTLKAVYGMYRLAQKIDPAAGGISGPYSPSTGYATTSKKCLGNALDLIATYDYTEDVQLGLSLGWFKPGKAFTKDYRHDATEVIGSMKVSF